jgi:hypothetical protein
MSKVIDPNNGDFRVSERFVLRGKLTRQELEDAGMLFGRVFDMKTGWVFRVTGPYLLGSHEANLALGFLNDQLRRVNFSLAGRNGTTTQRDLLGFHNQFLFEELGWPTEQTGDRVVYKFSWGNIQSSIDPRGGSCDIVLAWN